MTRNTYALRDTYETTLRVDDVVRIDECDDDANDATFARIVDINERTQHVTLRVTRVRFDANETCVVCFDDDDESSHHTITFDAFVERAYVLFSIDAYNKNVA